MVLGASKVAALSAPNPHRFSSKVVREDEPVLVAAAKSGDAAAFEELTVSHEVDALRMQVPDAWPNTFRQARFLSAVDFVQTDRLRRAVARADQRPLVEGSLRGAGFPPHEPALPGREHRPQPRAG